MYTIGSKILYHLEEADNLINKDFVYPITCEIDPSNYCQNNCKWCIYADYIKGNRCHLDFDLFKKIIYDLKCNGCKSITFTGGGEPLMNPNISKMIDFAYQKGFELGLITNGIALNSISDSFYKFKFIRISVDSVDSESYKKVKGTDYYNIVWLNIVNLVDKDVCDVGISMVFDPEIFQEQDIDRFYQLGERLGVKYSQVKPLVGVDAAKISSVIEKFQNCFVTKRSITDGSLLPCRLAGLIGQVGADGKYYYCCIHRGNKDFLLGDLRTEDISSLCIKRLGFSPDTSQCYTCRYLNYAEEYAKVIGSQYDILRHKNFL